MPGKSAEADPQARKPLKGPAVAAQYRFVLSVDLYTGAVIDREEIVEALHTVEDPELGMDIVELGLFYDVEIDGPKVKVIHRLTSMGCPAGQMIQEDIHDATAVGRGRRGGRGRADVRPAVDARQDVRRRQVHPRLRLDRAQASCSQTSASASATIPAESARSAASGARVRASASTASSCPSR